MQLQINESKSRNTAWTSFDAAIKYPINLFEERVKRLRLDGLQVEVITYPGDDTLKVLTDVLVDFDPDFDSKIRSNSQIRKMPQIAEFVSILEHFRLSNYTLQCRLCGKKYTKFV